MAPDEDAEHLTLAEAAQRLQIAPRTLERWANAGRIPSTVTADGVRLFREADLRTWSMKVDDAGSEQQ